MFVSVMTKTFGIGYVVMPQFMGKELKMNEYKKVCYRVYYKDTIISKKCCTFYNKCLK